MLVGFFLPGDSLLFAAGLLASQDVFNIGLLIVVLSVAAVVGDAVNYYLGLQMGQRVFEKGYLRFVKHSHLMAAKEFYERHGGKAIVLARFVPLVRTFTPFVAGVAQMNYLHFAVYNIVGGIGWVTSMTLCGYFLGRIPWISQNFEKGRDRHRADQRDADRHRHVSPLAGPPRAADNLGSPARVPANLELEDCADQAAWLAGKAISADPGEHPIFFCLIRAHFLSYSLLQAAARPGYHGRFARSRFSRDGRFPRPRTIGHPQPRRSTQ